MSHAVDIWRNGEEITLTARSANNTTVSVSLVGLRNFDMSSASIGDKCPMSERIEKIEKRQRRHDRLAQIMFDSDLVASRTTLAVAEFIWAMTLLWPGQMFSHPNYDGMAWLANETVWGLVFLLTAWIQWSLVMIGDFKCRFSRGFAVWNASLWVFCTASMYVSAYPDIVAIGGEVALAFASLWICVRPLFIRE